MYSAIDYKSFNFKFTKRQISHVRYGALKIKLSERSSNADCKKRNGGKI